MLGSNLDYGYTNGHAATLAPASSGKPSVTFFYRTVLPRAPKPLTTGWTPSGRFRYKMLAELCSELPFDGAAT